MSKAHFRTHQNNEILNSVVDKLNQFEREIGILKGIVHQFQVRFTVGTQSRLIPPEEAADFLGIAKGTLYQKSSKGEIPVYKFGRKIYFDREELEKFILKPENKKLTNEELAIAALNYSQN